MWVCVYVCIKYFGMFITISEFTQFVVIFHFVHYAEGGGHVVGGMLIFRRRRGYRSGLFCRWKGFCWLLLLGLFRLVRFDWLKWRRRCVTELHIAARRWIPHPWKECKACPCIIVSMIKLTSRAIMNTARIPALADPNVMNPFQIRVSALSAILSRDFSSKKFIVEMLPSGVCVVALPLLLWCLTWRVFPRET